MSTHILIQYIYNNVLYFVVGHVDAVIDHCFHDVRCSDGTVSASEDEEADRTADLLSRAQDDDHDAAADVVDEDFEHELCTALTFLESYSAAASCYL